MMDRLIFVGQTRPEPKLVTEYKFKANLDREQMEEITKKLAAMIGDLSNCDVNAYINIEVKKYDPQNIRT